MDYSIYKLSFKTGIRIGLGDLDSTTIDFPGDVLFSALVNEAARISPKLCEEVLQAFKNKDVTISDAFPFNGEDFLLPKPLINFSKPSGDSSEKKLYKKIQYIPLEDFKNYTQGKSNPQEILKKIDQLGTFQVDTKIQKKHTDNEIYHVAYYRFGQDNGLYFILGFNGNDKKKKLENLLYSLGLTGIGGKKTGGLGKFIPKEEELPKTLTGKINTKKGTMLLTSSMTRQDQLDQLDQKSKYALIRRGGFIYSEDQKSQGHIVRRKRTMHFFKAGSIFYKQFQGDIFRVDDGYIHPVYRYGIPMWLEVDHENL